MEPISARAAPDTGRVTAQHQRLQHFITDSPWSNRDVRRAAALYGVEALTARESITHWIVDDTGFLKQGSHSVGVKRQYTRSAGKLERRTGGRTMTVSEYANKIVGRGGFRRTTGREGTKRSMSARFAARRVLPIADEGVSRAERDIVWLLMEWEDGQQAPNKFHFITAPEHVTKKWLVRQVKQRWRTKRAYEDMKGQLGLDHFEGRRYPGWHHHVSAVLSCYAFIVAEHARHFPPRPEMRIETVRNASRPERHFADSFITVRRAIATWLPRCPCCHRVNDVRAPRAARPPPDPPA